MIIYIFMISIMSSSTLIYAGEGPHQNSEQVTSPQSKSRFSFFYKRSYSRSSSVTSSGDRQSDGLVDAFDSATSMPTPSSSSSSLSVTSPQLGSIKMSDRLARVMARLSRRQPSLPMISEQDEWVVVEDEAKKKSVNWEKELTEKRRLLNEELDKAQSIIIPGVIKASLNIFQGPGYESQAIAGGNNDDVADIQNTLRHLKHVLSNYLQTKEEYEQKLEINFERVGNFYPKGLYMYLGLTLQEGKSASFDDIKKRMDCKKKRATKDDTRWMLRQTEYVFDNSESKKLYDAYLEGRDSLFDNNDREHYWYLYRVVGFSSAAIESAAYEYNKLFKESQSQHNVSSPDLADQALKLELDAV